MAQTGSTTAERSIQPATEGEKDLLAKLLSWFHQELRRQQHNRFQMALDEDYYDSEQYTEAEKAELRGRGQDPVVYNEVKPLVDWLIGTERRTRIDFHVVCRDDDSKEAEEAAKAKKDLLKYLAEVNRVEFERSQAANECFKAGLGWMEVGVSADPEDEAIFKRFESWRNMLHDSLANRLDLDDSTYQFRFKTVDLNVAQAWFPKKKEALKRACITANAENRYLEWWNGAPISEIDVPALMPGKWASYDSDAWSRNERERVLIIECWHREPTTETVGIGPHATDRVRMKMRCTVFTERDILLDVASPYKHNKFPFIPMWAYRRAKDRAPYGPIRPVRGPQDSLNKRISKSLFVLSTNQTMIEKGAIDPKVMTAEQVRDELEAPNGFVMLNDGGIAKVKRDRDNDVAQGHLQLAQIDQQMIRNASGISDENLNRNSNTQSGVALRQKAEQGGLLTAELFDNMLLARQIEGDLTISLIEQFYNEPKVFSITGERQKRKYIRINQADPVTGKVLNPITAFKSQFIIGEQAWKQNLAQAAFEQMMELLGQIANVAPGVVLAMLDVVFELADIPNKTTVIQRIRAATGQTDPDEPLNPEQQAQKDQADQQRDMEYQAQLAQLRADIKAAEAKGEEMDARALKTRIESLYVAMQAGQVVATVPQVAAVADELLASVGFQDRNATPTPQPVVPAAAQPVPEAMPQPQLADGAAAGIETPAGNDGVQPGAMQ